MFGRHDIVAFVPVEQDTEKRFEVGRVVDVGIRRRVPGDRKSRDGTDAGGHETGAVWKGSRLARDGGTGVDHFFGFGQHDSDVIG
ncbi:MULTISPECIES: hypothetical protein [Amycolatopsis]|uniref:hypothetical protein n=1 Tax=Amycolatopsis TaxID=1813 RepID=UPI001C5812A8|nr:hypothetical protein [Amycolatopsis sp. TNS106]